MDLFLIGKTGRFKTVGFIPLMKEGKRLTVCVCDSTPAQRPVGVGMPLQGYRAAPWRGLVGRIGHHPGALPGRDNTILPEPT